MFKRYLSLLVIAAMLLPLLLALAVPASASDDLAVREVSWMKSTLDNTAIFGPSVSAQFDEEGWMHVSYYSENSRTLKYGTNSDNGLWSNITLDSSSSTGLFNSLCLGKTGLPWIAYYDDTNKNLKLATLLNNNIWDKGTADNTNGVGKYNSIAVLANSQVAIAYYDSNNEQLKVAIGTLQNGFTYETVGEMNPGSTSIGYYSDGRLWVSYVDKATLYLTLAVKNNGVWTKSVVENVPAGSYHSAAMGSNDVFQVAYIHAGDNALEFATLNNSVWTYMTPEPDAHASFMSLKVDFLNKAHLVYYDPENDMLKYVNSLQGISSITVLVQNGQPGISSALAVNGYAKAGIVYVQDGVQGLRYITNINAAWNVHEVSPTMIGVGKQNAIAIDKNAVSHIAYYNETSKQLVYANDATGSFVSVVVDTSAGSNPSIAVDANGKAYIAYYDATNKNLKYATDASGSWVVSIIDSSTGVGAQNAIAIYGSKVGILYTDDVNANLKFASMPSLQISVVDSSGDVDVGSEISMIADSIGGLRASYYRGYSLYYAVHSGSSWSTPTLVDDSDQFGSDTTIAESNDGRVFVAYYSYSSGLRLATLVSNSWTLQDVLIRTSGSGAQNSLTIDLDNQPQIGYCGAGNVGLEYSSWDGGIWGRTTMTSDVLSGDISSAIDPAGQVHILYYDEGLDLLMLRDLLQPPSAPLSLTGVAGNGYVIINWTAPIWNGGSSVNGYIIYHGYSSSTMTPIAHVTSGELTYNDTGLTGGVTMYYEVRSYNQEGASEFSNLVTATPTGSSTSGTDWLMISAIIVIIAVAAVGVVWFIRSRQ